MEDFEQNAFTGEVQRDQLTGGPLPYEIPTPSDLTGKLYSVHVCVDFT